MTSLKLCNQYLFASVSMIDSGKHNFMDLAFLFEYIQFPLLNFFSSFARDHMFMFLLLAFINLLTASCVLHLY